MPLRCCFEPTEADRKLAPTTVRHYHSLLSDILGAAVKWQYIPYNPCSRIDPPKKNDPEVLYLSDVQTKHFVKLLDQAPGIYRRAILLLLLTGMRRGELLGLEWRDIDWKASTISINRTSQYLPKHGIVTEETKTKKSKRLVEVSPQALQVLQEQYMWQQIQQHRMKCEWVETGKVITNEDGTLMRPNRLTAWFRRFVDKTDLPPIKLHSLRHTYATLLLAHGAPITAVSAQLGHANVATTANIYAHAIKSAQIASARIIGDLLDGYI
jgi:integrase